MHLQNCQHPRFMRSQSLDIKNSATAGHDVHTFNPSTPEAEEGDFYNSSPALFTQQVTGHSKLCRVTLYSLCFFFKVSEQTGKTIARIFATLKKEVGLSYPYFFAKRVHSKTITKISNFILV